MPSVWPMRMTVGIGAIVVERRYDQAVKRAQEEPTLEGEVVVDSELSKITKDGGGGESACS